MCVSRCNALSLIRRIAMIAVVLGVGMLASPTAQEIQNPPIVPPPTIVGSLANFDTVNDTEDEKEGFEIQLEGLDPEDVTRVFGRSPSGACYIRYCMGSITRYGTP